jgi:TPM domain
MSLCELMQVTKHRIIRTAIATTILLIALSAPGLAVPIESVPNPRRETGGWVSDGADILSPSTEAILNAKIDRLESDTGVEIAVVTVVDTQGGAATPKLFAHNLFNTWGIGKAEKNNGLLLLISKEDRRVEVEVGQGLVTKLTSDRIQELLATHVTPAFQQGDYDKGAIEGTESMIQTLQSEQNILGDVLLFVLLPIVLIVAVVDILRRVIKWEDGRSKMPKLGEPSDLGDYNTTFPIQPDTASSSSSDFGGGFSDGGGGGSSW